MVMAAGVMFRFGAGVLGVQTYGRTSEQGTPQKGASCNQRAAAESVADQPLREQVVC